MKKLGLLILTIAISVPFANADPGMGAYDAGLLNSQYMKEFKGFERGKQAEKEMREKQVQQEQAKKGFDLDNIMFENNQAFSDEQLKELLIDKIGNNVKQEDLTLMKKTLTKFYQQNGYTSAFVLISNKKADPNTIVFSIQEGPKNSVSIEFE